MRGEEGGGSAGEACLPPRFKTSVRTFSGLWYRGRVMGSKSEVVLYTLNNGTTDPT